MSFTDETKIEIRELEQIPEFHAVEELQKEVWGFDDRDVVPLTQLVAVKEAGGILLGAFEGSEVVGFVYGFIGCEDKHIVLHSHMLAVRREYRGRDLGYKLKLAQRRKALSKGITCISWTFDPLQSLNAHFNFAKLGVVADKYIIDFYGEQTSSFLHKGIGTDRLWVNWILDSQRVKQRLSGRRMQKWPSELDATIPLVSAGDKGAPCRSDTTTFGAQHVLIEIPGDITSLLQRSPGLAYDWRIATRWAFTQALAAGYVVEEFCRTTRTEQPFGVYVLTSAKKISVSGDHSVKSR